MNNQNADPIRAIIITDPIRAIIIADPNRAIVIDDLILAIGIADRHVDHLHDNKPDVAVAAKTVPNRRPSGNWNWHVHTHGKLTTSSKRRRHLLRKY